jgi:Cu/Ag efflux protein CusF
MERRACLLAVATVFAACARQKPPSFDYGEARKTYAMRGRVVRLRPARRVALIEHEKIGDWMDAMTMEFPVPSPEEFGKLKERSTIRATLNVNEMYYWLTAVSVE